MWLVALLAPVARSFRSTTDTLQPERAARRASPSPVTPPPSTSRSRSGPLTPAMMSVATLCTALWAWRRKIAASGVPPPATAASVGLGLRRLGRRRLGLRAVELVDLPVRLEVERHPRELARRDDPLCRGRAVLAQERHHAGQLVAAVVAALLEEAVRGRQLACLLVRAHVRL